ncbi:unnamed protein product [Toxocara canis]|uniref:Transposase n=1 Tax=Toxocara canis TaxID=6265 RepID=A0A183U569_TOXCA|nr:unnamed protein product [Toxocara canis]
MVTEDWLRHRQRVLVRARNFSVDSIMLIIGDWCKLAPKPDRDNPSALCNNHISTTRTGGVYALMIIRLAAKREIERERRVVERSHARWHYLPLGSPTRPVTT